MANVILHPADERHDDLVQEGRIAMWRAMDTYDPTKCALPFWLTNAAKMRMKDVAYGSGKPTGHEAMRGRKEAKASTSMDALVEEGGMEAMLGLSDTFHNVELAYHHGEIWEAIESLSPSQRRYVIARFWMGLDPSSREAGQMEARKMVPEISRRYLWTGSSKQVGARDRLAEALAHLVDA
jgi:RNA polymerase sigma factor (sigma-70 family)